MDMLEEKENVLHKKILLETERAKEFSKAKNKQGLFKRLGFFFLFVNRWYVRSVELSLNFLW